MEFPPGMGMHRTCVAPRSRQRQKDDPYGWMVISFLLALHYHTPALFFGVLELIRATLPVPGSD
jgi:hypothetical protein